MGYLLRRAVGRVIALALPMIVAGPAAWSFPKFAQKESKPCAYCHVRRTGGGPRTAAGKWYHDHGFSLAGFKPTGGAGTKPGADAPTKTGKPGASGVKRQTSKK